MIPDMPRPRPPYLKRETTRHGTTVWYVRIGHGPRTRLRAPYGSEDFQREYEAAIAGERIAARASRTLPHSLQWLWDSYRQTDNWLRLSATTRYQRENIMKAALATSGAAPFAEIKKRHIVAGLDRRAATPAYARNFFKTMRGLFQWAAEREHIAVDPTVGIKAPKPRKGQGFPAWTGDDVAVYHKRWPVGTRQRVWIDVLLFTGLRRGDAARVGRQHERDGIVTLRMEKGGEQIVLTLPVLDVLRRTLEAGPTGDLAWICGERGEPFVKESFGNAFSEAARIAGVPKSAHGVRKIAATIAAENGATESELEAIFGWRGGRMAAHYTQAANRARIATQAIQKLDGTRTSMPAPQGKVRARERKDQQDQS